MRTIKTGLVTLSLAVGFLGTMGAHGEALAQSPPGNDPRLSNTFRATNTLSFNNSPQLQDMVGGYGWDDMSELFTDDEVLDLGFIPDPLALILWGIADATLQNGQCYGMVQASQRFQTGQASFVGFPAWTGQHVDAVPFPGLVAKDTWLLFGPAIGMGSRQAPKLTHFVHIEHLAQMSAEFIGAWLAYDTPNGAGFAADIRRGIAGQTPPLLSISQDYDGHVIQPYAVRNRADGGFDVDTYDPNTEFTLDEYGNAALHLSRLDLSTLHINADGNWTFDDRNGVTFQGGLGDVAVVPFGTVPLHPHLPTSVDGIIDIISSFGGDVRVSQVEDSAGHRMFAANGARNRDRATRIPRAKLLPAMGGRHSTAQRIAIGSRGAYTFTLTGRQTGAFTGKLVGAGFGVELDGLRTQAGSSDRVTVDMRAGSVHLVPGSTRAVKLTAHAKTREKVTRSVTFEVAARQGAPIGLVFDATRETFTYTHAGNPASIRFELAAAGLSGRTRAAFTSAPVHAEAGDVIVVRPDWRNLARGLGSVTHTRKQDGRTLHLQLK